MIERSPLPPVRVGPGTQSDGLVIRALRNHGFEHSRGFGDMGFAGLTPTQLAEQAGVSRPSVYAVHKLLPVIASRPHSRHKSAKHSDSRLHLRADAGFALGVDVGIRHARVAICDPNGQLLGPEKNDETAFEVDTDPEAVLDWTAKAIHKLLSRANENHKVDATKLIGIGISRAAPISLETHAPHPKGLAGLEWQDIDIGERLVALMGERDDPKHRTAWRSLPIFTANDANLSALTEHRLGAARGTDHAIYLKWSGGVSAALILDGKIYRGSRGYAGEFGHMSIDNPIPEATDCPRCGKRDCLEMSVGAAALAQLTSGIKTTEDLVARAHTEAKRARAPATASTASDKDLPTTLNALEAAAKTLGKAVAPIVDALDPKAIVLGGAVGTHIHLFPHILAAFRRSIEERTMGYADDMLILPPKRHGHSAVHGATLMVLLQRLVPWSQEHATSAQSKV